MFNSENTTDNTDQLMDLNMDVIDIINVDLEVELYNSFLAKELEEKRIREEIERKKKEEERKKKEEERKKQEERIKQEEEDKKRREENRRKYGTSSNFIPFSGKGRRLGGD